MGIKVEVSCGTDRRIKPIRMMWEGAWLSVNGWEVISSSSRSWKGKVRTTDGRRFRMEFSAGIKGWRIEQIK